MTPEAALGELLARLAANRGGAVYLTEAELAAWPTALVAELKGRRWVLPASPATSVTCPGCEEQCNMPVETLWDARSTQAHALVVCDKRTDINRVAVPIGALQCWKLSGESLADGLARMLHLEPRQRGADTVNRWALGMLEGKRHKDRLALHAAEEGLVLAVAGHEVTLGQVFSLKGAVLWLDRAALLQLVDQPTGTVAAASESPDERQRRLLDRRAQLQGQGVRNFLKVMAQEEGVSPSAVKQVLARKPRAQDAMTLMAGALAGPVSKKSKAQR